MRNLPAVFAAAATLIFAVVPVRAKNNDVKYKTVEARHFDRAEGVELSPEFSDYLYAELRTQLQKTKIYGQVIGEGEVVDAADAPASIVVSGTLTEYKKGNVAAAVLVGFGAGTRSLKLQVNVLRRSDQESLGSLEIKVHSDPRWNDRLLAVRAAEQIAKEVKNALEHYGT
jgi:hypothetical protein